MTQLAYPAFFDQLKASDGDRRELCGETVTAAMDRALGGSSSPDSVVASIRSRHGEKSVQNGTADWILDEWNALNGIHHQAIGYGDMPAHLAAGRYIRVLIHDNNNADPDPRGRFEHWIGLYGDAPHWLCHNPWGGRRITYSDAVLRSGFISATALWRDGAPPPPQEDVMTLGMKRALVRLAFHAGLGRNLESQATEDAWASQIHDNGDNVDAVMAQICDSPEGLAWQTELGQLKALRETVAQLKAGSGVTPAEVTAQVIKAFNAGAAGA